MGETGRVSRLWSLKEGANLTYAAIDSVEAPGQIDVQTMKKALDNFEIIYSQSDLTAFLSKFRQF
jgi:3-dehydroquinate dehydratase-1